jgi:hypothetical protein
MNSSSAKTITLGKWVLFLMVLLISPGSSHGQKQ